MALQPATLNEIRALASIDTRSGATFHMNDELWARVIFEFASAYGHNRLARGQLWQSLTPLYLGRVASFVFETEKLISHEVEQRVEHLCLSYEKLKPCLISLWNAQAGRTKAAREQAQNSPAATPEISLGGEQCLRH
jgi:hypothetical protein